jgi:hypothetical protein
MTRLYVKGRVLGYTRGKRNQKPTSSLVQLEGVSNKEEAAFYLGKVRKMDLFFTPDFIFCNWSGQWNPIHTGTSLLRSRLHHTCSIS